MIRYMPIDLDKIEPLISDAVSHYWKTLNAQQNRQTNGNAADHGRRSAVTGGKQMDGFCNLMLAVLKQTGLPNAKIFQDNCLKLPGFFRPTKKWDLLIVHDDTLLAAMEFKSQRGPSFGNNFNNRSEEAIGTATDLWTAYREGAFGIQSLRPWTGWLMLVEDCNASRSPVAVSEPHFPVSPEFIGSSYALRYELLLRKLVREKLYDSATLLLSTEEDGLAGRYTEPAEDISIKQFLAGLAGHVTGYLAAK